MSDIYTTAPVPTASQSYEIGRAHGIKAEQERIIKLLEGLMEFETNTQKRIDHKLALQVLKDALIKGEK